MIRQAIATAKKTSGVWEFFSVCATEVLCSSCGETVSRGEKKQFNTTNLQTHLQTKHKDLFAHLQEEELQAETIFF